MEKSVKNLRILQDVFAEFQCIWNPFKDSEIHEKRRCSGTEWMYCTFQILD